MEVIFLGTSCMVPTKDRNHHSIFISHGTEGILVDCGEGTQRQLKLADIKPSRISKILISHWHGDHVLGLPGLFQTLNNSDYERKLEIFGPKGSKKFFSYMFKAFEFQNKIDYKITEIKKEKIFETMELEGFAYPLEHGMPCYGFVISEKDKRRIRVPFIKKLGIPDGPLLGSLQDNRPIAWQGKTISPEEATYIVKGKKIGIISDTEMSPSCDTIAGDADLLISEAAYESSLEDKAKEYKHLTARQAANVASRNNVQKLVLTHFSQRYKTTGDILDDAKSVFDNVVCAYDLMKMTV